MRVPSKSRPILRGWPFFLPEALTDCLQTAVQGFGAIPTARGRLRQFFGQPLGLGLLCATFFCACLARIFAATSIASLDGCFAGFDCGIFRISAAVGGEHTRHGRSRAINPWLTVSVPECAPDALQHTANH